MKSPEARNLLLECGDTIPITKNVLKKLKKFVLKFVYGTKKSTCAEARADQWKSMKKKSTQRLVPDEDTLEHICIRANYLSYCQKQYQLKSHPSPIGNGWEIINGKCRPVRHSIPALPENLCQQDFSSDTQSSSEDESDPTDIETSDSEPDD